MQLRIIAGSTDRTAGHCADTLRGDSTVTHALGSLLVALVTVGQPACSLVRIHRRAPTLDSPSRSLNRISSGSTTRCSRTPHSLNHEWLQPVTLLSHNSMPFGLTRWFSDGFDRPEPALTRLSLTSIGL
ncbi:hypothetical protein PC116_g16998 [Phytophthora cactorum]|nr:hypothetical protein PC114_g17469 [Phytophthora cactorum]KAG3005344.1 hypothetical protein PC120_g18012 [Phytophthora cactorum]KAG4048336.1 hypothetical protein PC123_g16347 [Phytophthora cactorum]KAG4234861.1 hypothetical protein PC116_g16998 [Phytophthora cactorum]